MKLPLRSRLALSFVAAVALVFALLGLYLHQAVRRHDTESTRRRLVAEVGLVEALLPAPPWTLSPTLEETVRALGTDAQARITLMDPRGRVVADSHYPAASMEDHANRPERLQALAEGFGSDVRASATLGTPMLYVARTAGPPGSGWIVRLAVPLTVSAQASRELQRLLLIAIVVATFVILLVSMRLADALTRPVQRLVTVARRVARGDLSARVETPARGELGVLGEVLNTALDGLSDLLARSQQEAHRYAALLEQMSDAVLVVDAEGRVQLTNRVFATTFGVEPNLPPGRSVQEVTLNYDLTALLDRAVAQRAVQHGEIALVRPQPRALYVVVTPLHDDQGRSAGAIALLRDLTEMQQMDEVRRDFVANASHELRTPAAAVKALAEALQTGALRDPDKGPRFVSQIIQEADRLTRLLDDMLTLTRVERGAELLHPQTLPAAPALAEALARVEPLAAARGVTLRQESAPDDYLYADPSGLQTVLLNLLDNAIKYTPAGGAVTLRGRPVPGGYELSVSDTGPGIAAEHLPRLFERFYRVDKARDRATGGTGLGLSIVKHLAEAHGGRAWVESTPGEGSTFSLFLPDAP